MLETIDLTRRFGDVTAVDARDASTVPDGLLTGFVGGNGAGKTTTMRMIIGVLGIDAGRGALAGPRRSPRPTGAASATCPRNAGSTRSSRSSTSSSTSAGSPGMDARAPAAGALDLLERFGLGDRAKDRVEKL